MFLRVGRMTVREICSTRNRADHGARPGRPHQPLADRLRPKTLDE